MWAYFQKQLLARRSLEGWFSPWLQSGALLVQDLIRNQSKTSTKSPSVIIKRFINERKINEIIPVNLWALTYDMYAKKLRPDHGSFANANFWRELSPTLSLYPWNYPYFFLKTSDRLLWLWHECKKIKN